MKSTRKSSKESTTPYPKLMIATITGAVVLFDAPEHGMLVNGKSEYDPVGSYSRSWVMDNFVDYSGSVTLEND